MTASVTVYRVFMVLPPRFVPTIDCSVPSPEKNAGRRVTLVLDSMPGQRHRIEDVLHVRCKGRGNGDARTRQDRVERGGSALLATAAATTALAQDYPSKPVVILVPAAAGGP